MTNKGEMRTITLDLKLTPVQKATFEIQALHQRPELMGDRKIGGSTPPDMIAENKRKAEARRKAEFQIVAKYGVFDEYLQPLHDEEARLSNRLEQLRKDIADVNKLRPKT